MKCKLCSEESTEKFLVKNKSWEKNYYYCHKCKFIFAESKAVLNDQEQRRRYQMHNNKITDPVYRDYFKNFIDYAFSYIENKKRVLDFGSGPEPVLADVLKESGFKVEIYDKFFTPDNEVFNKKYEIITSTEVFEHLEYPMEFIEKLLNILEEKGYLLLMTCFYLNDIDSFSKWWYIQDPTHISFFNPKTFEYIAKKHNLEIVDHNNKNIIILRKK